MLKLFVLIIALFILAFGYACGRQTAVNGGANSPTESYRQLYSAVKDKDTETIKKLLSKKSIAFGKMSMQKFGKTEEQAFATGFTGTTYSESMPEIRDERIKDDMGALEVWNSKDSKWEDLPFIFEDGGWKLAVGDQFAGNYKSPGKGRNQIEKEAANTNVVVPGPTVDANAAEHAPKPPAAVTTNTNKP